MRWKVGRGVSVGWSHIYSEAQSGDAQAANKLHLKWMMNIVCHRSFQNKLKAKASDMKSADGGLELCRVSPEVVIRQTWVNGLRKPQAQAGQSHPCHTYFIIHSRNTEPADAWNYYPQHATLFLPGRVVHRCPGLAKPVQHEPYQKDAPQGFLSS